MIANSGEQVFTVIPDDGDAFDVRVDLRDIRLWERISPRHTLRKLTENPSSDDFFSLVYMAIKRQRLVTLPATLDEWIDDHRVQVKPDHTVAALDRDELAMVIEKAMMEIVVTPDTIANAVMDLLEELPHRLLNPTRTAR
jgi:hypothetical protein